MIWHDYPFTQFYIRSYLRRFHPFIVRNLTEFIQNHFSVFNVSKTVRPVLTTYRNEIQSRLRIIVPLQTDRPAVMDAGVVYGFVVHSILSAYFSVGAF
jgi:hypothetical protein